MSEKFHYMDKLVKIGDSSIMFNKYYYPFGSKSFPVSNIREIICYRAKWWSGKWRIYGSGDFKTWWLCDRRRPSRDTVFILFPDRGGGV